MRKKTQSLAAVKQQIKALTGKYVKMSVCRGRKRVSKYAGTLENAFPSVFVVRINHTEKKDTALPPCLSYSYNDVLCGEVRIDEVS